MSRARRIVTLGGGHGQAALLRALRRLECDITAVVSVADDGGCSGQLRREFGVPPPGDLRLCLSSLAWDEQKARVLEVRNSEGRAFGNFLISHVLRATGAELQVVADEVGRVFNILGRVCPACLGSARLRANTVAGETLWGESRLSQSEVDASSLRVVAEKGANPAAVDAILQADTVFLGPGSFLTSVLACVLSPGIAQALSQSEAQKVFVGNLVVEGKEDEYFRIFEHLDVLQGHMLRKTGRVLDELALFHHLRKEGFGAVSAGVRSSGGGLPAFFFAAVDDASGSLHDPQRFADAIGQMLQIPRRAQGSIPVAVSECSF